MQRYLSTSQQSCLQPASILTTLSRLSKASKLLAEEKSLPFSSCQNQIIHLEGYVPPMLFAKTMAHCAELLIVANMLLA